MSNRISLPPKNKQIVTEQPIALVFRNKTGCRQYPFKTIDELEQWVKRKPYRDEVITVMPINSDSSVGEKRQIASREAPDFLRSLDKPKTDGCGLPC